MPTGRVRRASLETRMFTNINSFHTPETLRIARVTATGLAMGATIMAKILR